MQFLKDLKQAILGACTIAIAFAIIQGFITIQETRNILLNVMAEREVSYDRPKYKNFHPRFIDGYQACMDDKRNIKTFEGWYTSQRDPIIIEFFNGKIE